MGKQQTPRRVGADRPGARRRRTRAGAARADGRAVAGVFDTADRSRRGYRASDRRRSRARPVPWPSDHRASRGRPHDHRCLPQRPRPRRHRHEAEHGRRSHVVRAPADAGELGDVARGADDLSRGRREGHEAPDPVLGPLSHPACGVRRRRGHVERPRADRELRRHRRHGEPRAARARARATTWRCFTTTGGSSRSEPRKAPACSRCTSRSRPTAG